MKKRKVIIDTDPGIDDAIALAIVLFSDEIEVPLITTVAGNVGIDLVTQNTLKLLSFYNKKIPVAMGAANPLMREIISASSVHGASGMGAYDFPEYNEENLLEQHAVEAIRDVLINSKEKVTLMPIGPLTNIALLIKTYPEVIDNIDEVVLMGGALGRGNSGVLSEYNIDFDPEAAKIVFESSLKITMAPLDVGWKALVYPEDSEKIRQMNPVGEMFYQLFKSYRGGSFSKGLRMYDSTAAAYLLKPEMYEVEHTFVTVETKGEYTSGATIVDLDNRLNKEPNAYVCVDIDESMFKEWFLKSIENCQLRGEIQ